MLAGGIVSLAGAPTSIIFVATKGKGGREGGGKRKRRRNKRRRKMKKKRRRGRGKRNFLSRQAHLFVAKKTNTSFVAAVSLAGDATSILFVALQIRVCRDKTLLWSRQKCACRDKNMFVAKKVATSYDKHMFVATSIILSRQKTGFVATKMIHVAVIE